MRNKMRKIKKLEARHTVANEGNAPDMKTAPHTAPI
jgi:hypothetical protein